MVYERHRTYALPIMTTIDNVFTRKAVEFEDCKQFTIPSKTFGKGFSSIYAARLSALKETLAQRAKLKWGSDNVLRLQDLVQTDRDSLYIVAGILYKHQEMKKSVLREISEELQLTPQPVGSNYASQRDSLFLEDETLRLKLGGNHVNIQEIVTGLVCVMLGQLQEDGLFWVKDYCFAGCCPQPFVHTSAPHVDGKVLFISSLDFANNADSVSLNLLSEWITGMAGCTDGQETEASVVRVIIAGNSMRGSIEVYNHKGYFGSKVHDEAFLKESALSARRFDNFLSTIVQTCCVTLLPGEFDSVCHTLPQQPFHPCVIPKSVKFKSYHGATNPWIGKIGSRTVAGSSGQPVLDIMKAASLANLSPLEWLERTLFWRHYAPTAPDTLPAYPYFDTDPFVMRECPDIYFAGNMSAYDSKMVTGEEGQVTRLVCVPKFSETQSAVLVDLHDLNANLISFGVS